MRYVIIRDDDTNALTPIECLERLYRPFLDCGLPVNLAVIPDVSTEAKMSDGRPEGFLLFRDHALVLTESNATVAAAQPRRRSVSLRISGSRTRRRTSGGFPQRTRPAASSATADG